MKSIDLLITGGLGLVVLGLAAQLPQIQAATNVSQYYSPRTIPLAFLLATIALFAVLLLRDGLAVLHRRSVSAAESQQRILAGRRLLFLVAAVAYVLLFQPLGFVLSSCLFMSVTAFLLGARDMQSLSTCVAVAVVVTGVVYLVVVHGLESFLPELPFGR